jgi:hypothetical protein
LNRIESHFGAIDEFVCKNTDYLDWDVFGLAMAEHIRHATHPKPEPSARSKPRSGCATAPIGRRSLLPLAA